MTLRQGRHSVLELSALNIAVFAFLLSFAWEIFQHPFFHGMTEARHCGASCRCYAPD